VRRSRRRLLAQGYILIALVTAITVSLAEACRCGKNDGEDQECGKKCFHFVSLAHRQSTIKELEKRYFSLTSLGRDVTLTLAVEGNNGAVAQLGEHKAGSLGVRGSIPLSSTMK
jgi:hypothetical protein